jgi:hypothetical protein
MMSSCSRSSNSSNSATNSYSLVDFDDGHAPGKTSVPTKMAVRKYRVALPPSATPSSSSVGTSLSADFRVFDDFLPPLWCERAYAYAAERKKPWGFYVVTKELCLSLDEAQFAAAAEELWASGQAQKALSLVATRSLLVTHGNVHSDSSLLERIDGTAVWCLTSSEKAFVQYHLDYAELYRYETNNIIPPILAGTCHVSPIDGPEDMEGGAFRANVNGIEHYRQWGYKGRLVGSSSSDSSSSSSDKPLHEDGAPGWITVPYKRNRGILHDGEYPHLSTPIRSIRSGLQRVILGFNCFGKDLSECCSRAPEHSDAFNRTIKLYQTMAALGLPVTAAGAEAGASENESASVSEAPPPPPDATKATSGFIADTHTKKKPSKGAGISAKDLLADPALAKLIINAANAIKKKEREEQELQPKEGIK